MTMEQTETETETAGQPTPTQRGRYSRYDMPDGSIRILYRPDGTEQDERFEIPGALILLANKSAESGRMPNPMEILKALSAARKAG
jgi:hypothetical protein